MENDDSNDTNTNIKIVRISTTKGSSAPPTKRVITTLKKWEICIPSLAHQEQVRIIMSESTTDTAVVAFQQIKAKIRGYKAQDIEKQKYNPQKFVTFEYTVHLLQTSKLHCYYCLHELFVLYENCRDPKQWSLERLDNSCGHDVDNVVVACLECNLKRRTANSHKFVLSKQMILVKHPAAAASMVDK